MIRNVSSWRQLPTTNQYFHLGKALYVYGVQLESSGHTSNALPFIPSTSSLSSPIVTQISSGAPSNAHHPFTRLPTKSASSGGVGYERRTLPG